MSRLHIYTVHIEPTKPHPYEQARFVEEGFSWKAFFFLGFWALYQRLWWQALALFLVNFILMELHGAHMLTRAGVSILGLGVSLLAGFQANDWLRGKLRRNGYIIADVVSGDSLVRGQQRFFDRYFATHPAENNVI